EAIHEPDDERLGEPLCPDCFDYRRAVIWNALATELWRRTTIVITRALAAQADLTVAALSRLARLSYIKVVEYQRRGVVHLHVVVRLDGPTGPDTVSPLPAAFLEQAVRQGAAAARVPYPPIGGLTGAAGWGAEVDVRSISPDGVRAGAVAAYIAKYATKSTDAVGRLDHRLKPADLDALDLPPPLARLVTTGWELGGRRELAHLRLRDWAHTLGFRGHWLTKSRRYSTTFGALRDARTAWTRRELAAARDAPDIAVVKDWRYLGRGWANSGDSWLADTAAADLAESRRHARDARRADPAIPA
ncbi:MAG: replication initiator, partial [Acidimicrobiia bacterium]